MKGSGPKGIAQRRLDRIRVYEGYDHGAINITKYGPTGWISTFGDYAYSNWPNITDTATSEGGFGFIYDAQRPVQLGLMGLWCKNFNGSGTGYRELAGLWWSHDNERWYSHHSTCYAQTYYTGTADLPFRIVIPQPTQVARYWKIRLSGATAYFVGQIYVGVRVPENQEILMDGGEWRGDASHVWGAYSAGQRLRCGFPPDAMLIAPVSRDYTYSANGDIYDTSRSGMGARFANMAASSRFHISQLTVDGIVLGQQEEKIDDYDHFHPNGVHSVGSSSLIYPTQNAFAFKDSPKHGVAVRTRETGQTKIAHNLGQEPGLVIFRGGPYNANHAALWRDQPDVVTYFRSSQSQPLRTIAVWDADDTYVYLRGVSTGVMIALADGPQYNMKRGTYVGNGSTSGPTVSGLGFDPVFLFIQKDVGNNSSVAMITSVCTYGTATTSSNALGWDYLSSSSWVDMHSTSGQFQIITTDVLLNESGSTYTWFAGKASTRSGA